MSRFIVISLCLAFLAGCTSSQKLRMQQEQQRINAVQADNLNLQKFSIDMLRYAKEANQLVEIEAHPGRPITIDAARFSVSAPLDLEAIFNSQAFRRDWGEIFPKTTNGWDAFIAVLGTAERIAGSPIPWLASALKTQSRQKGIDVNGDSNNFAFENSSIDNDHSDRSDRSDNSDNSDNSQNGIEVLPIDTSETPVNLGTPPEETVEEVSEEGSE